MNDELNIKKIKILLVDDSEVIHKIVESYLKEENVHLLSAYDGKEGLAILEFESVDLILSDVNMPIMNGFDMCRKIKSGAHKAIPLIFLTAENTDKDVEQGHLIGANDYLSKPFVKRELIFRISNQLRLSNFQKKIKNDEKRHQHLAMITTLGHELNNSLTILSGAVTKLKKEKQYDEVSIEKIIKSKNNIAEVVSKLRNLDPDSLSYEEYASGVDMLSL